MSGCTHITAAPAGRVSVKFDIGDFYENTFEKLRDLVKKDKNIKKFT
jgi:hypothetical protein